MFDLTTSKGKITASAMKLAAEQEWSKITLSMIAIDSGISISVIKHIAPSKEHILDFLTAALDNEVLSKIKTTNNDQLLRDSILETIMTRFDVMQPFKKSIRSIAFDLIPNPCLVQRIFNSQKWMLEASGVSTNGMLGRLKSVGMGSIYLKVFTVWLEDEDPGMARTMAELDRSLRRAERSVKALSRSMYSFERALYMLSCRRNIKTKSGYEYEPESPSS